MEKLKRISTTLRIEDYKYAKQHRLIFSYMLRGAIRDHRNSLYPDEAEESFRQMRKKNENMSKVLQKAMNFIRAKGLDDAFIDEGVKINDRRD